MESKKTIPMLLLAFFSLTVFMTALTADTTGLTASLSTQLCNVVANVKTVVGIIALALFLIGGVLYSAAHFMPTDFELKKAISAWSAAMMTGGVVGIIIVLLAPNIVGLVVNAGGGAIQGYGGPLGGSPTTGSGPSCVSPMFCVTTGACGGTPEPGYSCSTGMQCCE